MTQTGYPLASTLVQTPQQWSNMAQNWLQTGVIKGKLNELSVYGDSTGMQVKVKSGQAWMGHLFQSDAQVTLSIATADATNPRIDRIVVRLDYTTDSIQLAVLQGIPAVSPTAPALTQNSTRLEISLAQVRVDAAVSTIAANKVTDERNFVKNANAIQVGFTDLVLQNGWVNYGSGFANAGFRVNEFNELELRGRIKSGSTTTGVIIATLPSNVVMPGINQGVVVVCHNGSNLVIGEIDVNADRTITAPAVANTYVSFDGVKIPLS